MSWIRNTGFKAREQDTTWLVLCQHAPEKGRKAAKKSHMDILSSNFKKSTLQIIEFS
jgi:hypothetical protein